MQDATVSRQPPSTKKGDEGRTEWNAESIFHGVAFYRRGWPGLDKDDGYGQLGGSLDPLSTAGYDHLGRDVAFLTEGPRKRQRVRARRTLSPQGA